MVSLNLFSTSLIHNGLDYKDINITGNIGMRYAF